MPNTRLLTLGQAAKLCGRSKPTLSKALKEGRLSYVEKTKAGYQIEPSELSRVFPYSLPNTKLGQSETPEVSPSNPIENSILQVKLDAANQRYDDAEKTIEDLRVRLDKSEAARERQDLLLADLRQAPEQPQKRGLWARLIG